MATLADIFSHISNSPAIIIPDSGPELSYSQLFKQIKFFQQQLIEKCHIKIQEAVAIVLPNSIEFTITFLAIALLRNIAAPLNPNYAEKEFKFYIDDSKSKIMIVPKDWVRQNKPAVQAAKAFNAVILEVTWDNNNQQINLEVQSGNAKGGNFEERNPQPADTALLLHTSGTTGRPKGVPLLHRNITTTMNNIVHTYNLAPSDRSLLVMPLFHVHGLIGGMLSTLLSGGTVVIPPKFSATDFWKHFLQYGCTWYTAVPTIHQILLLNPPPNGGAPKLRFIRSCSSSLAPNTLKELEKAYKAPVLEAYAMTEAAHQMTSNPLPPRPHKPGSVGFGQGVQVTILDQDGNPTEEGEICVKGANITPGYLNNPSANKSSFTKDGWFRTGDQGRFDKDGYLYLTGRIKELINRGGEKISPLEVDSVLLSHPLVAEAVSFAVPDEIYGQEVHATVVLKKDQQITEKELQDHCGKNLVKFKIPKKIYFTDVMPKTATGKIQRKNISETFFKPDKAKSKL